MYPQSDDIGFLTNYAMKMQGQFLCYLIYTSQLMTISYGFDDVAYMVAIVVQRQLGKIVNVMTVIDELPF